RGKGVAWQRCRPAICQGTFGEAGKYFLAAALPVTAVNVNEARCLRVGGGIQVPFRPFSWTISQIEVLRPLLAETFRCCGPAFGFLSSEIGSHMGHIEISQIAGLKRHRHPVHACCWTFLGTCNSRRKDTGCGSRGKSAAGERHDEPP